MQYAGVDETDVDMLVGAGMLQSVRLHILGQEAVESQEEDPLAVGNVGRCSCWHQSHCSDCRASHHHWRSNLGRP